MPFKGYKQTKEHAKKSAWPKGKKRLINPAWRAKIVSAIRGKKHPSITGEKNPNWKGGITPINQAIRRSTEYKIWRWAVFERDNFTCVWCGKKKEVSGKLNADHIKPFADYPELRFAIDNGRTLCVDCHKKTDTYLLGARYKKYKNTLQ